MEYRRLHVEKEPINPLLLRKIAEWHNMTPKFWIPDFKATEEEFQETEKRILGTPFEDLFLIGAMDESGELCGFIWAYRNKERRNRAMILSLFVMKSHREKGTGTTLKKQLEKLCIEEGVEVLETTVHYKNEKMRKINENMGYESGMISMEKRLK